VTANTPVGTTLAEYFFTMVKKYSARVVPTGVFAVTINYTIVPVFELRDINNIVKLSYDI